MQRSIPIAMGALLFISTGALAVDEVYFTTPRLIESVAPDGTVSSLPTGSVHAFAPETGAVRLIADGLGIGAIGLAVDLDGNLIVGALADEPAFAVDLVQVTTEGTTTPLGRVIDTTGGVINLVGQGFDLAVGPDGSIYFTRPAVFEVGTNDLLQSGGVGRFVPETGDVELPIDLGELTAVGLAFADDGSLFYNVIESTSPRQIALNQIKDDINVRIGLVMEKQPGAFLDALSLSFDLAIDGDGFVYFSTPRQFTEQGVTLVQAGVVRIDPTTGTTRDIIQTNDAGVIGLTVDETDGLYFGSMVQSAPLIVNLARQNDANEVDDLGPALDTSGTFFELRSQRFDLATIPYQVLRFIESMETCDVAEPTGSVTITDLLTFLQSWFVADTAADIDGNAGVDIRDLLFFLECWLETTTN